jgi:hypothetical protein
MKTVYTLTVTIPVGSDGAIVRRQLFFSTMKKRNEVRDEMKDRGLKCTTNIEHLYEVDEGVDAIDREQRWASSFRRAA